MAERDWFDEERQTLGMWIDGSNSQSRTRDGELITDRSWLLLLHSGDSRAEITLPGPEYGVTFVPRLDTSTADGRPAKPGALAAGGTVTLVSRSLLLLQAAR